ncbi:oxidoreductase [Pseudarthrobacter oxydans]|uniref:oxidoreductase n=1 Tax=Pseudarthrobacter oxydans TaxID=1671 RepID=UPI00344EF576
MKVWFITGASKGLGLAFAEAALGRGDRVAATARDIASLQPLEAKFGDAVLPLELDVTDRAGVAAALRRCHDVFGRLDVVVNNAGRGGVGSVEEMTEEEVRAIFESNFFGAVWVSQAALPYLRSQGYGHIIQISSIAGLVAFPMVGYYNASKFALEGLSEALAQEVKEFGIRVTLVEPGAMRTRWAHNSMTPASAPVDTYSTQREARFESMADEYDVNQPGDPVRAAIALLKVVDDPNPPLRLILGNGAFDIAHRHHQDRVGEWARWEDVSRGTDFPACVQ